MIFYSSFFIWKKYSPIIIKTNPQSHFFIKNDFPHLGARLRRHGIPQSGHRIGPIGANRPAVGCATSSPWIPPFISKQMEEVLSINQCFDYKIMNSNISYQDSILINEVHLDFLITNANLSY